MPDGCYGLLDDEPGVFVRGLGAGVTGVVEAGVVAPGVAEPGVVLPEPAAPGVMLFGVAVLPGVVTEPPALSVVSPDGTACVESALAVLAELALRDQKYHATANAMSTTRMIGHTLRRVLGWIGISAIR